MKLATVNPRTDMNMEALLSKDVSAFQFHNISNYLIKGHFSNFPYLSIYFSDFPKGIHVKRHESY